MGSKKAWTDAIEDTLSITWDTRDGTVIPETENVTLKNGAVKITGTFLYADLAGSSKLAELCPWDTTAKIIRAYLDCCVRAIKFHGGVIRSFDGDRVMGIFKNSQPNTSAVKCAREIDWMVTNVLNPKARNRFTSVEKNDIKIRHCIGIDTSEVRAVRTGIRDNNDLIWIGRAPSFAAKLSDIRKYPYEVYISSTVYNNMLEDQRDQKDSNGDSIWQRESFDFAGNTFYVYRTKTPLEP